MDRRVQALPGTIAMVTRALTRLILLTKLSTSLHSTQLWRYIPGYSLRNELWVFNFLLTPAYSGLHPGCM